MTRIISTRSLLIRTGKVDQLNKIRGDNMKGLAVSNNGKFKIEYSHNVEKVSSDTITNNECVRLVVWVSLSYDGPNSDLLKSELSSIASKINKNIDSPTRSEVIVTIDSNTKSDVALKYQVDVVATKELDKTIRLIKSLIENQFDSVKWIEVDNSKSDDDLIKELDENIGKILDSQGGCNCNECNNKSNEDNDNSSESDDKITPMNNIKLGDKYYYVSKLEFIYDKDTSDENRQQIGVRLGETKYIDSVEDRMRIKGFNMFESLEDADKAVDTMVEILPFLFADLYLGGELPDDSDESDE